MTADGKEFTYAYVPNAPQLVAQVAGPVHTVTNTYEANRDILANKTNRWKNKVDTPIISSYTYAVNNLGQRISVSTEGEAFGENPADWAWGYDALGQITSANEDRYAYDQIGNRRTSRKGDTLETVYQANALNQYAQIGSTTPVHDADGNLLTGLTPTATLPDRHTLSFAYNAENRPVNVSRNGEILEAYSYDHKGRRIKKGDTVSLYDGYNAIAEYKHSTRSLKTTYAWGNDLSGTAQGAGGVGGLLSVMEHDRQLSLVSYPCYGGNGNITDYLTEENAGTLTAHYEYDVFGQVERKIGKQEYRYQFSTKPYDFLGALNYYNFRNYDSINGRWIQRDLAEEDYSCNLYEFISNNSLNYIDYIGLFNLIVYSSASPDPKTVPVSHKDGVGESSATHTFDVTCQCEDNRKTMKCFVVFESEIIIYKKQLHEDIIRKQNNGRLPSLEEIYGHEQRHVIGCSELVTVITGKMKDAINETSAGSDCCEENIQKIVATWKKNVTVALKNNANHKEILGVSPPENGKPYPPIK